MSDYELDLLDTLIRHSETDEHWFLWLLRIFVLLAIVFFTWMIVLLVLLILKRGLSFQPYFQALAGAATALVGGIPYKLLSVARGQTEYFTWLKTQWRIAQSREDNPKVDELRSEFAEVRRKNFGKGVGA